MSKTYKGDVTITSENQAEWKSRLKDVEKITGNLNVHGSMTLPNLTSVGGYLNVRSSAALEAPKLTSVGSYLTVYGSADLPNLTSVGGELTVYGSATFKSPNLTSVGGDLTVRSSVTLPKLTSVGGDLYVHGSMTLPKLTSVGGDLNVYGSMTSPKLTSVGGDLNVYGSATFKSTNLTSVGGVLYVYGSVTLPKLTSVGGNLTVHGSATFKSPKLTSVTGDLYVFSKIPLSLEKTLWQHHGEDKEKKWVVTDLASDWLLERLKDKMIATFEIDGVIFPYDLFRKVRDGLLPTSDVFAIENMEQRRVAYTRMDKVKMRELGDYKVLDEVKDDGYGHPMKLVSFTLPSYDTPFYFLNCFCPSTGREYFLETRKQACWTAKMNSFGLDENVRFDKEW